MSEVKKVIVTVVLAFAGMVLMASPSFAEGTHTNKAEISSTANSDNDFTMKKFIALAAGLGIGIAVFGGALGQGRASAAALEGIARNPGASGKMFVPFILALALIESLVIYALVISFMLVGKL